MFQAVVACIRQIRKRLVNCMPRRLTTTQFVTRARSVHQNRYDYSLVNYAKSYIPVEIICQKHGIFNQTPDNHLHSKFGCPFCCRRGSAYKQHQQSRFFITAYNVHGDRYDYSLVVYAGVDTKVKIICRLHGLFEATPWEHLRGSNCSICAKRKPFNSVSIAERGNIVHNNKYDYSFVDYSYKRSKKVKIICPIHGMFEQNLSDHLRGSGCRKCAYIMRSERLKFVREKII